MAVDLQAAAGESRASARRAPSLFGRTLRMGERGSLWPWSPASAFLASAILWLLLGVVLLGTSRDIGWPTRHDGGSLIYLVTAVGLAPVGLLILESLSRNRAVLELRGIRFDYSAGAGATPDVQLELNLLPPAIPLTDSSTEIIEQTLVKAAGGETAVVDLALGDGWWSTRLLALAVGAAEHAAPQQLVVLGTGGRPGMFLGWIRPADLARALLNDPSLREAYDEAYAIGGLVALFRPHLRPAIPWPPPLVGYLNNPMFNRGGTESRRLILYDQLGKREPRQRSTPAELVAIAGASLHSEQLDRSWSKQRQVRTILEASGSHIALVTDGVYERLLNTNVERSKILRQLVLRDE